MSRRIDHAAAIAGRSQAYPHLLCSWSFDPASHRLSCVWAPPARGNELPTLAWSPRLVPDDAILIGQPA